MERVHHYPPCRAVRGLAEVTVIALAMAALSFFAPALDRSYDQAKESTLKAYLQRCRSGISHFQADTGVYPARLEDIVATVAPTVGGDGAPLEVGAYQGPYLTARGGIGGIGIPANPFADEGDTDITHHWTYTPEDGSISSAIEGKTLDGIDFTAL
jgi:hypothetical protein